MPRNQTGKYSKKRIQHGNGAVDVLLKIAKALGPSALKVLEGAAEGVGKRVGKFISGEGMQNVQGLGTSHMTGKGAKLAGGSKKKQKMILI